MYCPVPAAVDGAIHINYSWCSVQLKSIGSNTWAKNHSRARGLDAAYRLTYIKDLRPDLRFPYSYYCTAGAKTTLDSYISVSFQWRWKCLAHLRSSSIDVKIPESKHFCYLRLWFCEDFLPTRSSWGGGARKIIQIHVVFSVTVSIHHFQARSPSTEICRSTKLTVLPPSQSLLSSGQNSASIAILFFSGSQSLHETLHHWVGRSGIVRLTWK